MSHDDPGGPSPTGADPSGVARVRDVDEPPPVGPDGRGRARRRRSRPLLLALLVVALAVVVRTWLLEPVSIPSASMQPSLAPGDRLLVEKVSAASSAPRRGDVVVFDDPGGWLSPDERGGNPVTRALGAVGVLPSSGRLVKRVVGVAGDVVRCCDAAGRLVVNGVAVDEDYLEPGAPCAGPMIVGCRWRAGPVPPGRLFVMGDHRAASADSTTHLCTAQVTECTNDPYVDVDLVVGRAWALAWPWDRIGPLPDDGAALAAVPAGT